MKGLARTLVEAGELDVGKHDEDGRVLAVCFSLSNYRVGDEKGKDPKTRE